MAISTAGPRQNLRASGSVVANASTPSTNSLSLPGTMTQKVLVWIDFTLGSLTNATFTPEASTDGTNWYQVTTPGALQLTASGKKCFPVDLPGAKLFRVSTSSTGTTTSSDCNVDASFQKS